MPKYLHSNEIYPGLWIGDMHSSTDKNFLSKNNITCVLNCTYTMPFCQTIKSKIRIPVLDDLDSKQIYKMYLLLNKSSTLIAKALPNNNILVHCHAGRQRSVCVIAAFLMKYGKLSKNDALDLIKTKRPVSANPKCNFDKALTQFEQDLNSAQ